MEDSIIKAVLDIKNRSSNASLRDIFMTFYKERTLEILAQIAEDGILLDDEFKVAAANTSVCPKLKIGGTD